MATEAETGVRPEDLLDYNKRGLKLVGIGKNGKPCMRWTPIYDNPSYWTDEDLNKHISDFRYGVATVFGLTRLSDEQGPLYLNNLDIDSDAVHDILFIHMPLGPRCSLIQKLFEHGFVVKTRKLKGLQGYWLSHKQNKPIHAQDCKSDCQFEIKTDKSSGNATLPPSRHRNDPNFEYYFRTKEGIPISDDAYDIILEVLKDCLTLTPKSERTRQNSGSEETKQDFGSGETKGNGNGKSDGLELEDGPVEKIRALIQPIYKPGHRYPLVFSLSCVLRRQCIGLDSVIHVIENLAKSDGISQEIPDIRNAKKQVEDVFKDDISIIAGNEYLRNVIYSITGDRDKAIEIFSKVFSIIRGVYKKQRSEEERESQENWLAANVMAEYTCMTTNDNGELLIYDEDRGVYLRNQDWRIKALCRSIDHDVNTYTINEVINRVKDLTYVDRSKFDSKPNIINVSNGLLDIHTQQLTNHSPEFLSTVQIPVKYDPNAKCPNILKFLSQILESEDIRVVLQLIGYCLYRTTEYERAFIFFGSGSNGKSTLLRIIEYLLGFTSLCRN